MISQEKFDSLVTSFENNLDIKYLYATQFSGALSYAMRNSKVSWKSLNQDVIDAFKQALCNVFHGGCEPEFETEDAYKRWEEFSIDSFLLVTERELKEFFFKTRNFGGWIHKAEDVDLKKYHSASPFLDKSIPYYVLTDKRYGDHVVDATEFKKWKVSFLATKYGLK